MTRSRLTRVLFWLTFGTALGFIQWVNLEWLGFHWEIAIAAGAIGLLLAIGEDHGIIGHDNHETLAVGLATLHVNQGDRLVLRMKDRLHPEQLRKIREMLSAEFPGHKVLILENGADLTVLHQETP